MKLTRKLRSEHERPGREVKDFALSPLAKGSQEILKEELGPIKFVFAKDDSPVKSP